MFTLPNLPYDYSALEPFIDAETMHIHHDKHHASYVDNLNKLVTDGGSLETLLKSDNPKIRNNAGGHLNHTLFWDTMCENSKSQIPNAKSKLKGMIEKSFGDFPTFQEKFTAAGMGRFGSGWAWLVVDKGELAIVDTPNQDSPVSEGKMPILLLDVWEHAYYLKYRNMRADYIKAWWNVVNWNKVEENYGKVVK